MLKSTVGFAVALFLVTAIVIAQTTKSRTWNLLQVPGVWEDDKRFANYDGFTWYRCFVKVPATWKGDDLTLHVHAIETCHEVYFNGVKIGSDGSFPPGYRSGLSRTPTSYSIACRTIRPGQKNLVAFRIYNLNGKGGFAGAAPVLANESQAIALKGKWLFRTGDNTAWARLGDGAAKATFLRVEETATVMKRLYPKRSDLRPLSPNQAFKKFVVPDDLVLEQVLSEPIVRQPVFVNFDERGRMWVVQYLQYPNPAGLKLLSRDKYWRNQYDKVPPPPPKHFRGKDKITIHEDTNGDGRFDRHKTFVEGLNIVTAVTRGRDGVWVLNPPYLLFYPDKNGDDIPDSDPEVKLSGFGLEDTHSVVNSLCWGPDGWLYGAQGSTVSASVKRPRIDKEPVHSMGQLIWRYHPQTKRYEIFAEGGGNAFGVEIDSKGRVFSGHNGGNTRGFHYVQGGYYQKGFSKHGPISNPYAFGYFPAMRHARVPRFTHTFVIYEADHLPKRRHGKLFGVAPLLNHVVEAKIFPDGSSFQTSDLGHPVTTSDRWFRPVDIELGPDGALYIADWYDGQVNHYRNHEGQIDQSNGRIYRLRAKDRKPPRRIDLSNKSTVELVNVLSHENRWVRRTALRLLGDRKDLSLVPSLKQIIDRNDGQLALEGLWALHLSGGFGESYALRTLGHANPHVRLWTVRLLGDDNRVSTDVAKKLASIARSDPHKEVRVQLACTARRLKTEHALPIIRELLARDEDVNDIHQPLLLWWAIEQHAASGRDQIIKMLAESDAWRLAMVEKHITSRLMRRYAQSGKRSDLLTAAKLLSLAPTENDAKLLLAGFEEAFVGRSLTNLPQELVREMAKRGGGSLSLRLRLGDAKAVRQALTLIQDKQTDPSKRRELIQIFGETQEPRALPVLLAAIDANEHPLQRATLLAVQGYQGDKIASRIIASYERFDPDVQSVAQSVLLSREAWTIKLLEAVAGGKIDKKSISLDVVRKMTVHDDERISAFVEKLWGKVKGSTTAQMQATIRQLAKILESGRGSPYLGKKLFAKTCAKCHTLFTHGGNIGPDLTAYKRDDLTNMLLHIVNPSAEVREGFETSLIATNDGRVLIGFVVDRDNQVLVLRSAEGQDLTIPKDSVDVMRAMPQSIMPEGLLANLKDQEVRDLFAYLRSSQPLNERK